MQQGTQEARWKGAHVRRRMAVAGGVVAAAALATAPGALAGTALPCEAVSPCFLNTSWAIGGSSNPEEPIGSGMILQWGTTPYMNNPATEHIDLFGAVAIDDPTASPSLPDPVIYFGSTMGKTSAGTKTAPVYFYTREDSSGTVQHVFPGSGPGTSAYKAAINDDDGDGCWDIIVGPNTATECGLGNRVSFMANGTALAVDDVTYKAKAKVSSQMYLEETTGVWTSWPNGPFAPKPYKAPLDNNTLPDHSCYNRPAGFSGTIYMGAWSAASPADLCTAW